MNKTVFKRYLLFFGGFEYPSGGMNDFKGDFDSIEEAKEYTMGIYKLDPYDVDWAQIYDFQEGRRVMYFYRERWGRVNEEIKNKR